MSLLYTAVIADDHAIVRSGLKVAVETSALVGGLAIQVVGEAADGLEAITVTKLHKPSLLLLDISMPLANGTEVLLEIRRWSPQTKIVVFTAVTAPGVLAGFIECGVDGLFAKGSAMDPLYEKLPLILQGAHFVAPELLALLSNRTSSAALTPREQQTLNMIVSGRSTKEISSILHLSPKTVEKHRASLMAKLNVHSVAELLSRALEDGLIAKEGLLP